MAVIPRLLIPKTPWLLVVVALCASCSAKKSDSKSKVDAPCVVPRPKSQQQLPTTHARIFLNNLRGQIEVFQRSPTQDCMRLNRALFALAQYHGDVNEMQSATKVLDGCDPSMAKEVALARASQFQSLHLFSQAAKELEAAQAAGASEEMTGVIEDELAWNLGDYGRSIAAIRAEATQRPSLKSLARLAMLEHSMANYDEADAAFAAAEAKIRDTNPIPVAWLYVQRGHHHMELGEHSIAQRFFKAAVDRMPNYVAATEHLGEVLALQEKFEESVAMYEHTLSNSDNPEFMGALSGVYEQMGRSADAAAMREQATSRYLQLIKDFPAAMSWHAADFFVDTDANLPQAHSLLLANVKSRPNSEAYVALARVELARGQPELAKIAIEKALAMPMVSAELLETALSIEGVSRDEIQQRLSALTKKIATRFRGCE